MVFNIVPKLPRHPGFGGKFTNPSYSFSRSPPQLDHVNASKVSISVVLRLINICRSRFDTAASTAGSMDSVSTFWGVSEWLCGVGMSTVSLFVFSRRFVTDTLDLDLYRSDLDLTAASSMSNVSEATFQIVLGWLRRSQRVIASQVGVFDFWRLVDIYRSDLDPSASPSMRNVSIWTLCRMDRWHGRHW